MALTPGTRIGPFEITAQIGAGGMGEVYRARDTVLKREIALKILPEAFSRDPERAARFRREAEVLASLNHPGIAQICGFVEADGRRAIAMEFVDGSTLAGPLPLDAALHYARQMIEALEHAHDRGIIHRDLKPANIRVGSDGALKLLDFGLAKAVEDPAAPLDPDHSPTLTLGHTRAGQILGTPAYMAPEQVSGRPADRRSDIFAFGAVLYEMLTGARAFEGTSVEDTLASVLKIEPDWSKLPPEVPAGVRTLLARCLHKDRKLRLQAIGEARIALANLGADPAAPARTGRHSTLRSLWPVATAASLVAFLGVSAVHYRESLPEPALLRYTIPLPADVNPDAMALSPDGRSIAITARTGQAFFSLWVRDLSTLELKHLSDAGIPRSPIWSLDGGSILYQRTVTGAGAGLARISAAGGPPEALGTSDLLGSSGSSLDAQGRVLNGSNEKGIVLVEAGQARVIRPRPAGGVLLRYPEFVQDGRRFIYSITAGPAGTDGIYVAALDGKPDGSEDRRIFADGSPARYVPPSPRESAGHLFFVRAGTLVAQPVNPESFAPAGDAVPIAAGLRAGFGGVTNFLFDVTSVGTLAYIEWSGQEADITWYDRSGMTGATVAAGQIVAFALSRDGERLAISQARDSLPAVWIRDLARGTESRLTNDSTTHYYAVWSPGGARVAFSSLRTGNSNLYEKSIDSTAPERKVAEFLNRPAVATDWTRDGRYVLVGNSGPGLFAADGTGEPVPLVTDPYSGHAHLSPDNRWLAYSASATGQREVYVQPFVLDGKPAPRRWQISSGGGSEPRWSRDGRELFYLSQDQRMMAVQVKAGADFAFDAPVPLFELPPYLGNLNVFRYDIAPDGRFLVLRNRPGRPPTPVTIVTNWRTVIKRIDGISAGR